MELKGGTVTEVQCGACGRGGGMEAMEERGYGGWAPNAYMK
jgi:hypothetical protein